MPEWLIYVIVFLVGAVVVMSAVVYVVGRFTRQETIKEHYRAVVQARAVTLPLQLQAYERLAIFLERITPATLLGNHLPADTSADSHYFQLEGMVRREFEYNVSQQIYVSPECWDKVVAAKEAVLSLLREALERVPSGASAQEYRRKVLELAIRRGGIREIKEAQETVKREARQLM